MGPNNVKGYGLGGVQWAPHQDVRGSSRWDGPVFPTAGTGSDNAMARVAQSADSMAEVLDTSHLDIDLDGCFARL